MIVNRRIVLLSARKMHILRIRKYIPCVIVHCRREMEAFYLRTIFALVLIVVCRRLHNTN
jgi:hypothetical protein